MDIDSRLIRGGGSTFGEAHQGAATGAALTADGGAPYPGGVGRWLTHSSAARAAVVRLAGGCASAPPAGRGIGAMVVERFIEHLRFDNGYPPGRFRAPAHTAAQTAAIGGARRGAS